MKQIFSRVLLLLLITAAILGLSSCTIFFEQEEDIYKFDSSRFDREVVFGEELDIDSLSIEVFGSDGVKKKTLTVTESMVIKGDTDTIGDHELVIEYGGERWTVMYTVFYEIKFTVPDDPTQSSTQLVSSVDEIIMPDDPAISGSTFIGWSKKIPAELTGNMELFAIFADRITIPKFEATYGDKLSSLDLPEVNDAKWEWVDDPDTTFVGNATEGRSPNSFQILYIPNNDELDPIEFTTTVSVKKKTLTFTLPTSVEYDPDAQKYNFLGMYTLTGFVAGEEDYKPRVILLGDNNVSEIGKYSYTLGVADSNYRGDYVGYFEITPIKLTIDVIWKSGNDVETIIYGGQLPEYEYKVKDKDGNEYTEFLSSDLKVTVHTPALEVGTHYLTATLSDEVADDIDYTKYYSVNVNSAKLIVESKVMNPGDPKLAEEYVIYFGDTLSEIQFAYHPNGSWAWVDDPSTTVGNVGTNRFKAQFTPFSDNYDAPEPVWISLTVLPKELSFRITSPTRVVYDGQPHNLTYEIIDIETGEKFDKNLVVLGNESFTDASDKPYSVTLTFEDTNYLAKNNSFNITIDKASPEIASPSVSGVWKPGMKVSDLDISGVENDGLAGAFTWNNGGQPVDMPGNYEYYATFTPSDSKNYSPVTVTVLASVDKATPKFESNVTEYTGLRFNDGNYVLKNVISTTSDNSKGNVKFLLSDGTEITYLKNAGTYTVTVIVEADKEGYYKEIRKTVTVTIDKVDPVISLDIDNWTYGSAAKQPVADCNAIGNYEIGIAGYEYRLVGSSEWIDFTSASYPTKAGKYELRALVSEGANHNSGISETVTFTIDKQVVTVPTIASMTYNKGVQYPDVSSTALYTVAAKGTAGNMGGQDVNKYYVTLTLVDGDNYKWPGTESLTYEASYDITKALVNVIADFNGGEWTYNGTAQVNHSTTSDFGEVKYTYYYVSGSNRILVEKDDIVNAGNYLVVASVAGNNNYVAATSVEKSFTIKKAVVSRPVLNSDSFEFNGQLIKPTIVDNNATNKTLYYVSRNTGNTNVGENYEVILTIDASKFDNYRWEGQADDQRTLTLTYDITQAVVNIDSASQSDWTYLDSTILPVIKINKSFSVNYKYEYRLVGTENWTEIAPSDRGNYEVRITVLDDASGNANYVGGDNKSKVLTFTINPKSYDLDVTVNGGIYNKTDLTSGLSGVAGIYTVTDSGDAVTVAGKGTPAGTYTVTFTLVKTDDGVYNYVWGTLPEGAVKSSDGTTVTISYTIEQKSVAKPTFITNSFTYDLVNGVAKDYEVTAAQLNNFNAEYMTITCDKQNQAGNNYTATITLDSNYKWNDDDTSRTATVIWSINKAKAEIVVDTTTITKVFGQTVTLPTATTKFGTVECDTAASSLVDKGEYTVTYTVAGTDNYDGDTKTVKVVIDKATVTVSGISINGWIYDRYDSTTNKPTFTSAKTNTGVDVSSYVTFEYSANGEDGWTETVPTDAGTYYLRAKVSASEHENWDETYVNASETFKIAKQDVPVPVIGSPVYSGATIYPEISNTDLYTVAIDGTDGNKGGINVGTYYVTLTLTDTAFANYKWAGSEEKSIDASYTITKAVPVINPGFTSANASKEYDGASLNLTPSATAGSTVIPGDYIGIRYYEYIKNDSGEYYYNQIEAPKNVGTYYVKVTVTAETNSNWSAHETGYIEYKITSAGINIPSIDSGLSFTYNETMQIPSVSESNNYTRKWYKVVNGTDTEINKEESVNAGSYKLVLTLSGTNHVWGTLPAGAVKSSDGTTVTISYTIEQKSVAKPTFITNSFTYDLVNGVAKDYEVTAAQLNNFNAEYMTITCDKQNQAGNNYTATITLDSNYKWNDDDTSRTATVIWSINKAKAEIVVDTTTITKVFGQTVTLPTATTKFGTVECDTAASSLVDKGEYTVTYTVAGTDNYDGDTKTVKVVIDKATVTVSGISINGWIYDRYDSTTNKPTFTSAKTNTGVDVSSYVTFEYSANGEDGWTETVPTDAGTYYLRAKIAASENGNWAETYVNASETFKIAKQSIDAPAIGDLTYNGSTAPQYPNINDKDGWYTVALEGTDGNEGGINVGTYYVTLTLTDTAFANYKWEDEDETKQSTEVSYKIIKATPDIYPGFDANEDGKYGKTYDGHSLAFVPTANVGDYEITTGIDTKYYQLILKDGKYEYDEIPAPTKVGTYYIRVTVAAGENWNANNTNYIEYVISPDEITAPSITGSSEYYYDNTAKYPVISTPDGYTIKWYKIETVNGETVENLITIKETIINVGKYKVVISLDDATNYVWSDTKTNAPKSFEYEIKQNTVSVTDIIFKNGEITLPNTWVFGTNVTVDQTVDKTFGDVTFTYKYEYKLSSEGDDKYVEWTEASYPKNVGEYSIRVTVNGNENYAGVSRVETVTITQATETPTVSTPADFASKPGNPEFVQGDSENNDKLVLDYIPGTAFNVEEYLTVTLDTDNVVESNREIDRIVITKKSATYSMRAATVTGTLDSVGEYTVTYYFKTNDNYTDASVTITVIIEAKSIADVIEGETTKPTVNVNFGYDSTVFNNDFQTQSISVTTVTGNVDLVAGTDFTWTIKNSAGQVVKADEIKHADTYTVTIEGMGNYTGSVVRTFIVTKKQISISTVIDTVNLVEYKKDTKYSLKDLINPGVAEVTDAIFEYYVDGSNSASTHLENAGTFSVKVVLVHDDYKADVTVSLTVKKNTSDTGTPSNMPATYGNKLFSVAGALPDHTEYGTWSWENADENTTVGPAGENTFYAVFTPHAQYAGDYDSRRVPVIITVSKSGDVTISTNVNNNQQYNGETGYEIKDLINPSVDGIENETFTYYLVESIDGVNVETTVTKLTDAKTYRIKVVLVHANFDAETYVDVTINPNTTATGTVNVKNEATFLDKLLSLGSLPTSVYGTWTWADADKNLVDPALVTVGNATTAGEHNDFYAIFTPYPQYESNYAKREVKIEVSVGKYEITKPDDITENYTGSDVISSHFESHEHYSLFDVTYQDKINVGEYTATLTLKDDAFKNYKWKNTDAQSVTVSYKISESAIQWTITGLDGWTFGDPVDEFTVVAKYGETIFGYKVEYKLEGEEYTEWTDSSYPDNAGAYTIRFTAIADDIGSYENASVTREITVSPRSVSGATVTLNKVLEIYSGSNFASSIGVNSVKLVVNGVEKTLVADTDYTVSIPESITNVGEYTITVTGKGNYSGTVSETFTVNVRELSTPSVTGGFSFVFNTEAQHPTIESSNYYIIKWYKNVGGNYEEITSDLENSSIGVGNYVAVVTLNDAHNATHTNIKWAADATTSFEYSITHKNIEDKTGEEFDITIDHTYSGLIYTGNPVTDRTVTVKWGDIELGSADCDITIRNEKGKTTVLNAGTYTITVTGKGNYTGTRSEVTFTVGEKSIDGAIVTLNSSSATYENTDFYSELVASVTGVKIGTLTVTYGNVIVATDTAGANPVTEVKNAGTYYVIVMGTGNFEGTAYATFEVKVRTVEAPEVEIPTVNVNDSSVSGYIYSGSSQYPTVTTSEYYTIKWYRINGDDSLTEITADLANGSKNVGNYKIVIELNNAANQHGNNIEWAADQTTEFEYSIVAKSIADATVTLGSTSAEYTGNDLTPTVTVTLNGKEITVTSDYTVTIKNSSDETVEEIVDAGTYTITVTGTGNYTGSVTRTFEVAKANAQIFDAITEADIPGKTYDGKSAYDAVLPVGSVYFIKDGVKGYDTGLKPTVTVYYEPYVGTANYLTAGADGKYAMTNAGTYTITYSFANDNFNEVADVVVTVTIGQATESLGTWLNATNTNKTYGDTLPTLPESDNGTWTWKSPATGGTLVGDVTGDAYRTFYAEFAPKEGYENNYATLTGDKAVAVNINVAKATPDVDVIVSDKTYDGNAASVSVTVKLTNNSNITISDYTVYYYVKSGESYVLYGTDGKTAPTDVGYYAIRVVVEQSTRWNGHHYNSDNSIPDVIVDESEYDATFSITKRTITGATVSLGTGTLTDGKYVVTYANTDFYNSITANGNITVTVDGLTATYSVIVATNTAGTDVVTEVKNAGTYYVIVTGTGNFEGTAYATFEVKVREITAPTFTGGNSFVFNGLAQAPTVTHNTVNGNNTYYSTSIPDSKNVGNYAIVVTLDTATHGDNIKWADGSVTSYDYKITPMDISDIVDGENTTHVVNVTFGSLTYNGGNQTQTVVVTWQRGVNDLVTLNANNVTDYTWTIKDPNGNTVAANEIEIAGTYTVVIRGTGNYTGSVERTFEVAKADAEITGTPGNISNVTYDSTKTYLENLFAGVDVKYTSGSETGNTTGLTPTVTVVYAPFFGEETTTTVENGNTYEIKNAGTYTITYSFANDNFNAVEDVVVTVTIGQATESLGTWLNATNTNGFYGDTLPTLPKSDNGTWTWKSPATGETLVGDVTGDAYRTFYAEFAPKEGYENNYAALTDDKAVAVNITVVKATPKVDVTVSDKTYDGTAVPASVIVSLTNNQGMPIQADYAVYYYVKNAEGNYELYGTDGKTAPTDVGDYAIRVMVEQSTNWNGHELTGDKYDATFSITAKEVIVDLGSEVTNGILNLTYNDGKSFDLTTELGATFVDATGTPIKDGIKYYMMVDEVPTDVTSGYITNHGEYTVTIKLDNANYTVTNSSELTVTVKVAKKGIDLPGYIENLDYIGDDQTPAITHNSTVINGIEYKDLYVVTYENNGENQNVGTYGIYFKLTDEAFANYKWNGYDENVQTVEDKTYKINRVDPSVSVVVNDDDKTKPYDSSVMSVTVTVTVPEATLVEGTNYAVYYYVKNAEGNYVLYGTDGKTAPTNVGDYAIRVVVEQSTNWNAYDNVDESGNVTKYDATFSITKKSISGATVSLETGNLTDGKYVVIYANTDFYSSIIANGNITVTVDELDATYSVIVATDAAGTDPVTEVKNAGTYYVIVTGTGNFEGTATATFTVNTATVNVTGVTLDKTLWTYDGSNATITDITTNKSFTGITFSYTYTFYKKDANGYYQKVSDADEISDITDAGEYKVVVTLVDASENANGLKNYVAGTQAETEFTINQKSISDATVIITGGTLTDGQYVVTYANKDFIKDITFAGITLSGYNDVTLVKDENSKVILTFTDVNGTPVTEIKNAGTYKVVVTGTGNYTGTATATFVVEKQKVNIVKVDNGFGYQYTGSEQNLVLQNSGLFNATGASNMTGKINVDTYTVFDLALADNSNYEWGENHVGVTDVVIEDGKASFKWSIAQKDIANATVNYTIGSTTYTGSEITLNITGATLTGYSSIDLERDNQDNIKVVIKRNEAVVGAVKEAGSYTITVTGSGNFTGTASATFEVKVKEIDKPAPTVAIPTNGYTFNNAAQYPTATTSEYYTIKWYKINSDNSLTEITADLANGSKNVGNYKMVISLNNAANQHGDNIKWKVAEGQNATADVEYSYSITAASITGATVTIGSTSAEYTGNNLAPTVTVKITLNGKETTLTKDTDFTVTIKNSKNETVTEIINADTYTISVTGKGNYKDTATMTKTFTVTRAAATVSGEGASNLKFNDSNLATSTSSGTAITKVGAVIKDTTTALTGTFTYSFKHSNTSYDAAKALAASNATEIKNAGYYVVTINFVSTDGNYEGSATVNVYVAKKTASDVLAEVLATCTNAYYHQYSLEDIFLNDARFVEYDNNGIKFTYEDLTTPVTTAGSICYQTLTVKVGNVKLNSSKFDQNNYDVVNSGESSKAFKLYIVAYLEDADDSTDVYWRTIEEAVNKAQSGATVWVMPITAVDSSDPITITRDCTINSGVTLVLPYGQFTGSNSADVRNSGYEATLHTENVTNSAGEVIYTKYTSPNELVCTTLVKVAKEVVITLNGGTLEISGELSGGGGGSDYAGHTARYHAVLELGEKAQIVVDRDYDSSIIKAYGFITEETKDNESGVTLNAGVLWQPFTLRDFGGGTYMATFASTSHVTLNGNTSSAVGSLVKDYIEDIGEKYGLSAFNEFQFINVHPKLTINYYAEMNAWANLYADSQQNDAEVKIIGNSDDYLIKLTNAQSSFVGKYNKDNGVTDIDMFGGAELKYLSLKVPLKTIDIVGTVGIDINTSNLYFPISWAYDISLNNGDYVFNSDVQLMPGSRLEVGADATLTSTHAIYVHKDMTTISVGPQVHGNETSTAMLNGEGFNLADRQKGAEFIVNGVLSVHTFAGMIKSNTNNAQVTITNITRIEFWKVASYSASDADGNGTKCDMSSTGYAYATLSGNTATPTAGITYKYNGTNWVYSSIVAGFETNGGNTIADTVLNANSDGYYGTLPANPTKSGYTFVGWYMDSAMTVPATIENGYLTNTVTSETITLYAKWVKNTITVDYAVDGGIISGVSDTYLKNPEYVSDTSVRYTVTLPTIARAGYTFLGWYNGNTRVGGAGETYTFTANSLNYSSTVTLTAKWEIINYTIEYVNYYPDRFDWTAYKPTFSIDGLPTTMNATSSSYVLGTPISGKDGYTFSEWYVKDENGVEHTIESIDLATVMAYADGDNKLVVYGEWTQETVYTITFVQVIDGVETPISSMTGLTCTPITYTESTFGKKSLPSLASTYNGNRAFAYEFVKFVFVNGDTETEIESLTELEAQKETNFTIRVVWTKKYELKFNMNNGLSGDYSINIAYNPAQKVYLNSTEISSVNSDSEISALKAGYETVNGVLAKDAETQASKYFKEWTSTVDSTAKTVTINAVFDDKYTITVTGSNGGNTGYTIDVSGGTFYLTEAQLGNASMISTCLSGFETTAKSYDSNIKANKYFDTWYTDSAKTTKFFGTFSKPSSGKSITLYANWNTKHTITISITTSKISSSTIKLNIGSAEATSAGTYYANPNQTVTISITVKGKFPYDVSIETTGYNTSFGADAGSTGRFGGTISTGTQSLSVPANETTTIKID